MLSHYQNRRRRRDDDVYHTAGHAFPGALSWRRNLLVVVYGARDLLSESRC